MRRIAMQAIYLANQGNLTDAEEVCQKALKALELKSFPDYSAEIVNGVLANKKELDEQLSKYLKRVGVLIGLTKLTWPSLKWLFMKCKIVRQLSQ